ncbi:MAG: DUF1015 domain-containing protein [Deltaproteobacteria bacterium]|nr:DUF1015 domain-containing protein [Deltaproteobacteria bacterium]
MAKVAPFRAVRYNQELVPSMTQVVTPPYDVISDEELEEFYARDPHNIIRIELNRKRPGDNAQDNRYLRSAEHLRNWLAQGYLIRDDRPAFYISETTYQDALGDSKVRHGFFTLLRVEDPEAAQVLPHERTFTSHKEDRFRLTEATRANVSPIFALYPDDDNEVQTALATAPGKVLLEDFVDPMGLRQKLYAVRDPQVQARVQDLMASKVIFIADGHHRYETSLNYRNFMRGQHPEAGPDASFNYVMTYLCSMSDPGLTVFACHRELPNLHGFAAEDFLRLAKPYFEVAEVPMPADPTEARDFFTARMAEAGEKANTLGLVSTDSDKLYLLSLKPGVMDPAESPDLEGPLAGLDVSVLTHVVLDKILGLDEGARDKEHTIKYVANMAKLFGDVKAGKSRLAFLLNPTKVEQVKAVAEAGLTMPRKATYFYPKVLTGLTINLMDPGETVG